MQIPLFKKSSTADYINFTAYGLKSPSSYERNLILQAQNIWGQSTDKEKYHFDIVEWSVVKYQLCKPTYKHRDLIYLEKMLDTKIFLI